MPSDADAGVAIYLPSDVDQCNMHSHTRYAVTNINLALFVACNRINTCRVEMR